MKTNLPPFQFPNEPEQVTKEERAEYKQLIEEMDGKRFESVAALEAFKEFAPEYARFKELHEKFQNMLGFRRFVSYLTISN